MQEALKERNIILRRIIHGTDTQSADAYILHFNNHWITLRKFGDHWIDFDSRLDQPKVIKNVSIEGYVKHMQETASVFVLEGDLSYQNNALEDIEFPDLFIDEAMSERRKGQKMQSQKRKRLDEEAKERKRADDDIRHLIAQKEEDTHGREAKRKAIERSNESSDQRASRLNKMKKTTERNRQEETSDQKASRWNKMRETAARNRQEETRDQRATSRLKQKRETAEKPGRKRKVIRELPD